MMQFQLYQLDNSNFSINLWKAMIVTRGRYFSANLKAILENEIIPARKQKLASIRKVVGDKVIGKIKVDDAIMGMRSLPLIFYDGSAVDPIKGINFRGHTIEEFCEKAFKAPAGEEPLPECMFFLLATGRFPNQQEFQSLSQEWKSRSELTENQINFVCNLPKDYHPMTMLSMGIMSLQNQSKFYQAYHKGLKKADYWRYYYEDAMDLLAKIPRIAALVYRHKYKDGHVIEPDHSLDWAGNYAHMLGFTDHHMKECMRAYLSMHSDHEGYNVSAHTSILVGSALSDPYLSYSAALNGLAGPLHGLASQQSHKWLTALKQYHNGVPPNEKIIEQFVRKTIAEGRVVPGYGHAVLRAPDPRFLYFKAFADRHIKNDEMRDLAVACFHAIPKVMKDIGKLKNPYPNIDAFSGILLDHYGLREYDFFTVCFGVSRAMGCLANGIWCRALGLPMEKPSSFDMNYLQKLVEQEKQ